MLELKNVSKTFPGVKALDSVSMKFEKNNIYALLGENGAGKSTLVKIISGVYQPDKGSELFYNNDRYDISSTYEAIEKGIITFHQELNLFPQTSIAENIMIDKMPLKNNKIGIIDWKETVNNARKYLDLVGLKVDPTISIQYLNTAQKQLVRIAKALSSNMKILLLDEPTSSLTTEEANNLFEILFELKKEGILIIFISHILEEVLKIASKVNILRDGKCVLIDDIKNLNRDKIIRYMIGRTENRNTSYTSIVDKSKLALEVKHLNRGKRAHDISFALYKGEILGFYGLVGSGRTELAKMIIGYDKYDSGEIIINSKKVTISSISNALFKYRLGYLTEDRKTEGLILTDNIKTNINLTTWDRIANVFGIVSRKKEVNITRKQIKDLDIKCTGINHKVGKLSGGNQQKVSIAKWLAAKVDILIADEPTVGIDIGSKEFFSMLLFNISKMGKSIILISSDMPEIIRLSNRILVFSQNKIVGELDNNKNYEEMSSKITECISEFKVMSI